MYRVEGRQPHRYLARGGVWPSGPFRRRTPIDLLISAVIVRRLARAAHDVDLALEDLAEDCAVDVQVLGVFWCAVSVTPGTGSMVAVGESIGRLGRRIGRVADPLERARRYGEMLVMLHDAMRTWSAERQAVREAIADGSVSRGKVAERLGLSRQRVDQLVTLAIRRCRQ